MVKNKTISKYYDKRSVCQVLGILMHEPEKIKKREFELNQKDFSVDELHQIIFTTVYNLAYQGVKQIGIAEIENYLANTSPLDYKKFTEKYNGLEWLVKVLEDANPLNLDYYYNNVRKMSLLRSYLEQGINIKHILDKDEIDPNLIKVQEELFDKKTMEEIIREVDQRNLDAKRSFIIKEGGSSRKLGDNNDEIYERMMATPSYGLTMESEYLNTIMRGGLKGKFLLETRDTGTGKSRIAIKRLLKYTCPILWDYKEKKFANNPDGIYAALYIGTEMDLEEEIEPMAWAFVSGVEEHKIKDLNLTDEESERVEKAKDIVKNANLFLEDEPNFDLAYLWQTIEEYKVKHNIYAVALDYIELTGALMQEFSRGVNGMAIREDQVLLNLSAGLKNIAKKLDVFMMAFTQTTDEARRDGIRDQRAVKGARSLPNKVDVGIVTFEPTKKELEQLEPVIEKQTGLVKNKIPNVCYSFYKNRGGRIKNVKVWGHQDLGNMEYIDLFCTDDNYNQINIDKTKIQVVDDKIAIM